MGVFPHRAANVVKWWGWQKKPEDTPKPFKAFFTFISISQPGDGKRYSPLAADRAQYNRGTGLRCIGKIAFPLSSKHCFLFLYEGSVLSYEKTPPKKRDIPPPSSKKKLSQKVVLVSKPCPSPIESHTVSWRALGKEGELKERAILPSRRASPMDGVPWLKTHRS